MKRTDWIAAFLGGLMLGLPTPGICLNFEPQYYYSIGVMISATVFFWDLRRRIKPFSRRFCAFLVGTMLITLHFFVLYNFGVFLLQAGIEVVLIALSCGVVSGILMMVEAVCLRYLRRRLSWPASCPPQVLS
jgi:hypothetical protein